MKSAVVFITQACNYKCPYCIHGRLQRQNKDFEVEPFLDVYKWAEALNKLGPDIVDFSGGEPFLQPDFVELINSLKCNVAFTTNASQDLTEFVEKITPTKVTSITMSFHPTQEQFEVFLGKVMFLKGRGFNVTVNFVAYPEQMYMTPAYQQRFNSLGIKFHTDPYKQSEFDDNPFTFSDAENRYLEPYIESGRKEVKERYNVLCSGGQNHFSIQPNGDVYRCLNDRYNHKNTKRIGNIFDEDFKPNSDLTLCDELYRCIGCDRDKVETERSKLI